MLFRRPQCALGEHGTCATLTSSVRLWPLNDDPTSGSVLRSPRRHTSLDSPALFRRNPGNRHKSPSQASIFDRIPCQGRAVAWRRYLWPQVRVRLSLQACDPKRDTAFGPRKARATPVRVSLVWTHRVQRSFLIPTALTKQHAAVVRSLLRSRFSSGRYLQKCKMPSLLGNPFPKALYSTSLNS